MSFKEKALQQSSAAVHFPGPPRELHTCKAGFITIKVCQNTNLWRSECPQDPRLTKPQLGGGTGGRGGQLLRVRCVAPRAREGEGPLLIPSLTTSSATGPVTQTWQVTVCREISMYAVMTTDDCEHWGHSETYVTCEQQDRLHGDLHTSTMLVPVLSHSHIMSHPCCSKVPVKTRTLAIVKLKCDRDSREWKRGGPTSPEPLATPSAQQTRGQRAGLAVDRKSGLIRQRAAWGQL